MFTSVESSFRKDPPLFAASNFCLKKTDQQHDTGTLFLQMHIFIKLMALNAYHHGA